MLLKLFVFICYFVSAVFCFVLFSFVCVCEAIITEGRYLKKTHKKIKSEQIKPKITETLKKTDVSGKVVVKRSHEHFKEEVGPYWS